LLVGRVFREYLLIFLITGLILFIKFNSLFTSNSILPGWDTLGHYYAFLKGLTLLQHGELRGYTLSWFGGMPFFYFYPALAFWLMGLVALLFSSFSTILIFKAFLFLCLAFIPVTFHFFVKAFFPGKRIYPLATLSFSLAYLFYQPFEFGGIGIGITGAIPVGLFIQTFATNFVLIFLAYFKKLLTSSRKDIFSHNFFGAIIFGTLTIYSHILSTIFAAFFALLISFFYLSKRNIKKIIYLGLGLILTSAYSLFPLFAYLGLTSGSPVNGTAYYTNPLLPLLGFDINDLFQVNFSEFLNFNWVWFFIFIFFIVGIIKLFKSRHFILPVIFLVSFILIPGEFLNRLFPTIPIHYYRIMPLIMFFYMSIGVIGLQYCFDYLSIRNYRALKNILILILLTALTQQIFFFDFLLSNRNIKPRLLDSYIAPLEYHDNFLEYDLENHTKKAMKYFYDEQIKSRVFPEISGRSAMIDMGSAHYVDTFLPLINKTPVISGLYSESSYQTPFLFTPMEILTSDNLAVGDVLSLSSDEEYNQQSSENIIKDLSLFNTKYFMAIGANFKKTLTLATSSVEKIDITQDISPIELYKTKITVRDYISSPKYLPALYINEDHNLAFRDFSLGWYKMFDVLDFPVIYDGRNVENINNNNLANISFLIIHANNLSLKEIEQLKLLNKKVVVLSEEKYQGDVLPNNFELIEDFRPAVNYYGRSVLWPTNYDGLNKLTTIFKDIELVSVNNKSSEQADLRATTWQDENIIFSGQGPIIINASYFPNWRSQNSDQEVYQVTPGQMLVFATGKTNLKFSSGIGEKISGWVSFVAIIFVSSSGIFLWKRRKKKGE